MGPKLFSKKAEDYAIWKRESANNLNRPNSPLVSEAASLDGSEGGDGSEPLKVSYFDARMR